MASTTLEIERPATPASADDSGVEPAPRRSPGRRARHLAGVVARRSVVPVALIVLWQVASDRGWIDAQTLASPSQVWKAAQELWGTGELWSSIVVSLQRVGKGLAIGVSIGLVLGVVAGLSRLGEELIDAPLQMLRTLPFLGLLPLLLVWLGIGEGLKVGLVVIGVIFPIYLNVHKGIRGVDPRFRELAQSCEVGRWGLLRRVILPGALPSFLLGLRFALGVAWLSLVVAETVNADKGIGYLMMRGREYSRTDIIVLGLVIYAILGLILEGVVRLVEHFALPWRQEFVG